LSIQNGELSSELKVISEQQMNQKILQEDELRNVEQR